MQSARWRSAATKLRRPADHRDEPRPARCRCRAVDPPCSAARSGTRQFVDGTDLQLMIDRSGYDEEALDEPALLRAAAPCAAAGDPVARGARRAQLRARVGAARPWWDPDPTISTWCSQRSPIPSKPSTCRRGNCCAPVPCFPAVCRKRWPPRSEGWSPARRFVHCVSSPGSTSSTRRPPTERCGIGA